LVQREDNGALETLEAIAGGSKLAAARVQAACALEGLSLVSRGLVEAHLSDADPRVRRNAVRLAEGLLGKNAEVAGAVLKLVGDQDAAVRYQVALSLGEWDDPRVPGALAKIAAAAEVGDVWTRAAVMTAAGRHATEVFEALPPEQRVLRGQLAALVAATGDAGAVGRVVLAVAPPEAGRAGVAEFNVVADLLDALGRRRPAVGELPKAAAERIAAVKDRAREVARGAKVADADVVAAMRLLCRDRGGAEDVRIAADALDARRSPAQQGAGLSALARSDDPAAPEALIGAVPHVSPVVRARLFDVLTARPRGVEALLGAVEGQKLSPADLPAATREKLLKSADADVRGRAEKVLASARPAARVAVVRQYQGALSLKGDAGRGRALFEKTCSACHRLGEVGSAVGPDLAALTDRSSGYLLTAILDPNAAVEGRFAAYQLETKDGETYVGLLAEENAAGLTILQASGVRQTVPRAEVKSLTASKLSLMPEGLEQGMSAQDLSDVMAFVQRPGGK
jgi:putative heme-binding domain-containing protein